MALRKELQAGVTKVTQGKVAREMWLLKWSMCCQNGSQIGTACRGREGYPAEGGQGDVAAEMVKVAKVALRKELQAEVA